MELESQKMSAYAALKFGRGAALALAMASAGLGVSLYMAPAPAYAIYCSNCSTFYQQMYEYAEAVNTQLNTAQQLQTQIQQYDNMIKQGMSLPSRMFNTITGDLQRVASVYNSAQSLGRNISNLDEQFRQQFKGYDSYLNSIGQGQNNMPQRYRDWPAAPPASRLRCSTPSHRQRLRRCAKPNSWRSTMARQAPAAAARVLRSAPAPLRRTARRWFRAPGRQGSLGSLRQAA